MSAPINELRKIINKKINETFKFKNTESLINVAKQKLGEWFKYFNVHESSYDYSNMSSSSELILYIPQQEYPNGDQLYDLLSDIETLNYDHGDNNDEGYNDVIDIGSVHDIQEKTFGNIKFWRVEITSHYSHGNS